MGFRQRHKKTLTLNPGHEVIKVKQKIMLNSFLLRMKIMLIFISINAISRNSKARKSLLLSILVVCEQLKFHAHLKFEMNI